MKLQGRPHVRPHECKTCGKRFTLLENLNRHQMIHTNQRPFHCPYCSKSFRLSQHLKEHIRIHTGEKPYKCHICGHAFCQISNLKSHQKTHTKVKGFRCDICGKEFRRSFTLKQHKLTHSKPSKTNPKEEVQQKPSDFSRNGKQQNTVDGRNPKNSAKYITNSKFPYPLNPLLCNQKSSSLNSKEIASLKNQNFDSVPTSQFMTFWNSLCQNKKMENMQNNKLQQETLTAKLDGCNLTTANKKLEAYSQISKLFGLSNPSSMSSMTTKEEKIKPLQNFTFLSNNNGSTNHGLLPKAINGLVPATIPSLESNLKHSFFSSTSGLLMEQKFRINSEQAEKVALDVTSRKRKQASSLQEAAMTSPTFCNDDLVKNNIFSKARQSKSLTLSQEYNWKRQLCREWLDEETGQRRSISAEAPHDNHALRPDAAKCRVVSLSADNAKQRSREISSEEEARTKYARSFSSYDDDVFSPTSNNPTLLIASNESRQNSSTKNTSASQPKKPGYESKPAFYFPDVAMSRKPRFSSENNLVAKDINSIYFNVNSSTFSQTLPKNDGKTLLFPNKFANPLLKHNVHDLTALNTSSINSKSLSFSNLESRFVNDVKSESLSYAKPWPEPSPSYNNHSLTPHLPVSPDLKSLSSHLSFVPLVTWKPVVTGWRNIVDGNVYPARLGVENLNPFSLQQQIS